MMIRNAKVLGLALVALLAMTAVMASAAHAEKQFTSNSYPVTISGTQSEAHKFTVGGSTVTCTTATFSASLPTGARATLTVTPVYTNCTAFGFIGATVTGFPHTGGSCDYLFGTVSTVGGALVGNAALECNSGDITIDAGPCTATMTAVRNQNLTSNTYTNNTPVAGQVTVDTNVTNVHAEITKSEFGCPVAKGTYPTASYTGKTVVKGENGGVAVSIDVG